MEVTLGNVKGLSSKEVLDSRAANGKNLIDVKEGNAIWMAIKELLFEPMLLLLLATSGIYFVMGRLSDGYFMLGAIVLVSGISLFQNARSQSALAALKQLTQPKCKVLRDGKVLEILTEDIVVGDVLQIEEGHIIPADAEIVQAHDFAVNESSLTGESLPLTKTDAGMGVFQGTTVVSGLALCTVTGIGNKTELGKISKSLAKIEIPKTPLQIQINDFVKKMVFVGLVIFLAVWGIHFYLSGFWLASLLKALTLAMSIVPEEIPVAYTTFMALGAWRLMKSGVLVTHTQTVESLGSATVICTDKTGTITENAMTLAEVYLPKTAKIEKLEDAVSQEVNELITIAMWASEPIPFDPMEKAIHDCYGKYNQGMDMRNTYSLTHEYALGGKPPMMTHVFTNKEGGRIIAAKGAPEAILACSNLNQEQKGLITKEYEALANQGFRVLGVGKSDFEGEAYPETQQEFKFEFMGFLAFYDPPKKNMKAVFDAFYEAGIQVKIITGDSEATTATIAKEVGFKGADQVLNGADVMEMDDLKLKEAVKSTFLFTRMFPEAKLKIINALKSAEEIVAMTGDGVNDGPALTAAHIGIAMGKRGTEIAKQASSLILIDDNFDAMVDAVAMGRRIYLNLKKAIQYIISIHIPIILTVMLPLSLGWIFPSIFSPVHIIFLELIMGPTCSIIYENEPMEKNLMHEKPRPFTSTFFSWKELTTSIVQGLFISIGTIGMYLYSVNIGLDETSTRAIVFLTLIAANVFLTFVNRSFEESVFASFGRKNNLIYIISIITVSLTAVIYFVPYVRHLFELGRITGLQSGMAILVGAGSVLWFEVWKMVKRMRKSRT